MQIFYLDTNLKHSVRYHVNKHVVKMPIESAQVLCTVLRERGEADMSYKSVYRNHPITRWADSNMLNFHWLNLYGLALCKEYRYRWNRVHATESVLANIYQFTMHYGGIGSTFYNEPPMCVSARFKVLSLVNAYRAYYLATKSRLFEWSRRPTPYWINEIDPAIAELL